ncbi:NAD(P)H-dependent oxidoreductase [Archangium violaceum]|uniref:NAD(P)H-dependent oxidoreductase n=1 Tax=Archangium violaceum TaxID=83451 RepID=UPI0019506EE4|nr:NAD(P)H-dependent oxidoreductase [Archangium violaceum]QRO02114.1 NAD(P)H-dependent oxidoreductase [Archangium violaceum]
MNTLIVLAHPDPHSLNAALARHAAATLERAGHSVQITDLYRAGWSAVLDRGDFPQLAKDERLRPVEASRVAYATGCQPPDVTAEQARLRWADLLILQFPMWWFTMPAILKGWFERVYAYGFAYGVGEHSETHWGDRYGEGMLVGKRAMLSVTVGGWASHYGPRGVNGPIDDLLFPINHGMLFYPGFDVLRPFVVYRADKLDAAGFDAATSTLGRRLATIMSEPPIPYRRQNHGDYNIPSLELRAGLGTGRSSFALHVDDAD